MPKGLKPIRKRLASGAVRLYWYHRATGRRVVADPTTAEGFLEVARLDDAAEVAKAASAALTGSYAALWAQYRDSPKWRSLKPRTRSDYQAVRDWLGDAAQIPLWALERDVLIRMRDKAETEKGRRFANYVVQVVRLTLEWGKDRGLVRENVGRRVKLIAKPKSERATNRAWTLAEVSAFIATAPDQLVLPFALALFAGMRQGDALKATWTAYDGTSLRWTAGKNSEAVCVPVSGLFKRILDAAKERRGDALQIAANRAGSPWSQSGFRASFFKHLRSRKIGPGCTFHGLRHTIGTIGREAGFSESQVAAAIGDRSPAMAAVYGRDADAAIGRAAVLGAVGKQFANADWKPRTAVSNRPKMARPK